MYSFRSKKKRGKIGISENFFYTIEETKMKKYIEFFT
jgi:hypothetical protein